MNGRTDMATATLTDGPAVQLTFPWALPKAEDESTIVAECVPPSPTGRRARSSRPQSAVASQVTVDSVTVARVTVERHSTASPAAKSLPQSNAQPADAVASSTACAGSLQAALSEDRIGKPFRVGAVMFRLLKRYGITDEEIAEGIASYTAKRNARV